MAPNDVQALLNPSTEPARAVRRASKPSHRREQCRTNQQRYRDKQKLAGLCLEADVLQLREVVKQYELARDALTSGSDAVHRRACHVVTELFSMFRFGLSGASLAFPIRPHALRAARSGSRTSQKPVQAALLAPANADDQIIRSMLPQLAFLRSTFAPDVEVGGLRGMDALVEQMWRYSCYFTNPRLELEGVRFRPREPTLSLADPAFVLAIGALSLTVSPTTMMRVFPLASGDERIANRLVGKRLDCAIEINFEFERRDCQHQCTRISTKLDMMSALRVALGPLDEVAAVLDGALLSPEGLVGDLQNHPTGSSCDS